MTGLEPFVLLLVPAIVRAIQTGRTEELEQLNKLLADSVAGRKQAVADNAALDAPQDEPAGG